MLPPSLFHGLSAFPITPVNMTGRLEEPLFARLIERVFVDGVDSVAVLGSTGTYAYLNAAERKRATEVAAQVNAHRLPLIVGVGAITTRETIELARYAATCGADGLLIAPVSYTPLTEDEVFQHYRTIAAETDLPICIYNNPGTTHFTFSVDLLRRLSELPTVKAVKMPSPTHGNCERELADLRIQLPQEFLIGYSGDWGACGAIQAGADCWYSVIAGTLPAQSVRLMRAAQSGDPLEAGNINAQFETLWQLFQSHGSLRVVYAIHKLLDLCDCELPRPLLPLPSDVEAAVLDAVERCSA